MKKLLWVLLSTTQLISPTQTKASNTAPSNSASSIRNLKGVKEGKTPLHLDVENYTNTGGYYNWRILRHIRDLIYHSADPDIQDINGQTPLHYSAEMNKYDITKLLVKASGNVNIKDNYGKTPLQYMVEKYKSENVDIKNFVSSSVNPDIQDSQVDKILNWLLWRHANIEIIYSFIKATPNIHIQDKNGNTVLHLLITNYRTDIDVIDDVIRDSIQPNIQNKDGNTILHLLISKIYIDYFDHRDKKHRNTGFLISSIQKLLKASADPDIKNKDGDTPLHLSLKRYQNKYRTKIIITLMKASKDLNIQDSKGDTPLHLAFQNNDLDLVKFLLINHANPKINNHKGHTALDLLNFRVLDPEDYNSIQYYLLSPEEREQMVIEKKVTRKYQEKLDYMVKSNYFKSWLEKASPEDPFRDVIENSFCLILQVPTLKPVQLSITPQVYDAKAIEKWLSQNSTDPLTRTKVTIDDYKPNLVLAASLREFIDREYPHARGPSLREDERES